MLSHLLNKSSTEKEKSFSQKNKKIVFDEKKNVISPLESLNDEQYKAATSNLNNAIVIASAGTGKTSTIIARVYYLINTKKIPPQQIVLLTFTSKAGKEMLERLGRYFPQDIVDKIFAGTFHSYGKKILDSLPIKHQLIDDKKINFMLISLYQELSVKFGITLNPDSDDEKVMSTKKLVSHFGYYTNTITDTLEHPFAEWLEQKNDKLKPMVNFYDEVISNYIEEKKRYKLVDFTDYLLFLGTHFKNNKISLGEIIVDEYQDTNALQNEVLKSMVESSKASLFCVGDYDQSIYSFNGSDIGIIASFKDRYPDTAILSLNKNYRSVPSILGLAEKIITKNLRIYPKQ